MEPTVITEESDTPIGRMCIDVFGAGWGSFKIAHMSTGDKIGVEMFEFKNNETPKGFEYWKTSTFHFCVQDPDIEGLVEKIKASYNWYQKQAVGLGDKFIAELEVAYDAITELPETLFYLRVVTGIRKDMSIKRLPSSFNDHSHQPPTL